MNWNKIKSTRESKPLFCSSWRSQLIQTLTESANVLQFAHIQSLSTFTLRSYKRGQWNATNTAAEVTLRELHLKSQSDRLRQLRRSHDNDTFGGDFSKGFEKDKDQSCLKQLLLKGQGKWGVGKGNSIPMAIRRRQIHDSLPWNSTVEWFFYAISASCHTMSAEKVLRSMNLFWKNSFHIPPVSVFELFEICRSMIIE